MADFHVVVERVSAPECRAAGIAGICDTEMYFCYVPREALHVKFHVATMPVACNTRLI
jgi:hypothetical protein